MCSIYLYIFISDFLPIFDTSLSKLATERGLTHQTVEQLTFETMIKRMTNTSWYPVINNYFFVNEVIPLNEINYVRNVTIGKLMVTMPKYNINHFWNASIKTLIYQSAFYLKSSGTKDVFNVVKNIYRDYPSGVSKEIASFQSDGPYLTSVYPKLLMIIKSLQVNETLKMIRKFKISKEKLTFLTHDTFYTVNEKLAKLIFYKIHNNVDLVSKHHEIILNLVKRIQLYHASIFEWSITCAKTDPPTNYSSNTLDSITNKCFQQTFKPTAKKLYKLAIHDTAIILKYNMEQAHIIAGNEFNKTSLQNASMFLQNLVKGAKVIDYDSKKPYILLGHSVGLTKSLLLENTLKQTLERVYNYTWSLIQTGYGIKRDFNVYAEDIALGRIHETITKIKISKRQLPILPIATIMNAFHGNESASSIRAKFKTNILVLSKLPIKTLEIMFELSSTSNWTLYDLSQHAFGLLLTNFLDYYSITTEQNNFFQRATLNDIGLLLAISQTDLKRISLMQLITQMKSNLSFSNVMLKSPKNIVAGKVSDLTSIYKYSIPQIVHQYDPGVTSQTSFTNYVKQWSTSSVLARILKEKDIKHLSSKLTRTPQEVIQMRVIDIVKSLQTCKLLKLLLKSFSVIVNVHAISQTS